ncbi:hypothetical protein CVD19_19570 [Bacillus sp. T33-2]|nr:hypothetical protein CVD19_19570 [Bacillus sp. T33-2]
MTPLLSIFILLLYNTKKSLPQKKYDSCHFLRLAENRPDPLLWRLGSPFPGGTVKIGYELWSVDGITICLNQEWSVQYIE